MVPSRASPSKRRHPGATSAPRTARSSPMRRRGRSRLARAALHLPRQGDPHGAAGRAARSPSRSRWASASSWSSPTWRGSTRRCSSSRCPRARLDRASRLLRQLIAPPRVHVRGGWQRAVHRQRPRHGARGRGRRGGVQRAAWSGAVPADVLGDGGQWRRRLELVGTDHRR
ncbi:uncharacterized protein LOC100274143 [Zea mays]|jgi:hypothetical protein|uniref:Uncharacterized protein n=1 Tax=Zea mays TaxID=4577 RepID=B4FZ99_MAIZE|nr:uncharacterized protein LOC100274143 [Zea mays]ACF87442.1 unknown [Zea mays]|eukprot:NP_001141993.1 uncharacterized protein LOC100274143 [Zea mays]